MARIAFHLRHPVANRLGRRLELLREIVGTTPCAHQLHHSAPVFRRIPCMTLGHRGSPSLSPLRHCPPNRVNSKNAKYRWVCGQADQHPTEPQSVSTRKHPSERSEVEKHDRSLEQPLHALTAPPTQAEVRL